LRQLKEREGQAGEEKSRSGRGRKVHIISYNILLKQRKVFGV
jgi:hypothetical protein